jgi:hypothetical protein
MEARSKLASVELRLASPVAGFLRPVDRCGGAIRRGIYTATGGLGGWRGRKARMDCGPRLGCNPGATRRDSDAGICHDLPLSLSQPRLAAHPRFLLAFFAVTATSDLPTPANDSDRSSPARARSIDHPRPAGRVSSSLRSPQLKPKGYHARLPLDLPGASCSSISRNLAIQGEAEMMAE